jgi:hypothetical protein
MGWPTAGEVVSDASVEIGLSPIADPFSSNDPNVVQLCQLLKSLGRDLINQRNWSYLRKEYGFTTVQGQSYYPLPPDFRRMIDQTWWNRTNRLPVGGPLSPQEWQYLRARLVGVVFNVLFRPDAGQIQLYPVGTTPGGQDIYFEYESKFWVSSAATPTVLGYDAPTTSDQLVWFDPLLLTRGLKYKMLQAKGFDTSAAAQDYFSTLESIKGSDSPAPVVSATRDGTRGVVDPLIGSQSVPITGYGS